MRGRIRYRGRERGKEREGERGREGERENLLRLACSLLQKATVGQAEARSWKPFWMSPMGVRGPKHMAAPVALAGNRTKSGAQALRSRSRHHLYLYLPCHNAGPQKCFLNLTVHQNFLWRYLKHTVLSPRPQVLVQQRPEDALYFRRC